MEDSGIELQIQLHKLSSIDSEETLQHILCTLWNTRKTGLRSPDKSQFQSLLNLASLSELDPVLACLRWLMRKFVYQNLSGDEVVKLFPADLPFDLQSILLLCFKKNGDRWKEDVSREQDLSSRTSVPYQARPNAPPSFSSPPSSAMPASLWSRQDDDSLAHLNHGDFGISTPNIADVDVSGLPAFFQCDNAPPENMLHDYSKSPLGETEVKFQLTRDTLEAMLRSMTYINEQLSAVGTSSGPANKKQKQ